MKIFGRLWVDFKRFSLIIGFLLSFENVVDETTGWRNDFSNASCLDVFWVFIFTKLCVLITSYAYTMIIPVTADLVTIGGWGITGFYSLSRHVCLAAKLRISYEDVLLLWWKGCLLIMIELDCKFSVLYFNLILFAICHVSSFKSPYCLDIRSIWSCTSFASSTANHLRRLVATEMLERDSFRGTTVS